MNARTTSRCSYYRTLLVSLLPLAFPYPPLWARLLKLLILSRQSIAREIGALSKDITRLKNRLEAAHALVGKTFLLLGTVQSRQAF
jgi:hypothetical protein